MQYDGTGKISEAIADLCGVPPKSSAQIAELIKQAKDSLAIESKSKNLPDDVKLAIYQWHYKRLNPSQDAEQPPAIENSLTVTIDPEPTPDTTKPQHGGNWGGTRPNAGRKTSGKQTAVIRVNKELVELFRRLDALHSQGVDIAKRIEPFL